jgi:hypothetical protein
VAGNTCTKSKNYCCNFQYKHRIEHGFDLNHRKRAPKRVDSYYGITGKGDLELGPGADKGTSAKYS